LYISPCGGGIKDFSKSQILRKPAFIFLSGSAKEKKDEIMME
jgi:hypothetical protein